MNDTFGINIILRHFAGQRPALMYFVHRGQILVEKMNVNFFAP